MKREVLRYNDHLCICFLLPHLKTKVFKFILISILLKLCLCSLISFFCLACFRWYLPLSLSCRVATFQNNSQHLRWETVMLKKNHGNSGANKRKMKPKWETTVCVSTVEDIFRDIRLFVVSNIYFKTHYKSTHAIWGRVAPKVSVIIQTIYLSGNPWFP